EFQVTFAKTVSSDPFTGRVFILLAKEAPHELPRSPNWFRPEPFFAQDVKDWKPEQTVALSKLIGYPAPLAKLPKGTYYVQAVMDFDRGERSFAAADGNGYSKPVRVEIDPAAGATIPLQIDQVYKAKPFRETERIKLVDIR